MDAQFTDQYLTFSLAGSLYAAPIRHVHEVIEFNGLTEVPLAPTAVPGVINLRGAVVPVVDLSVRLGGPRCVPSPKTCVVVVDLPAEGEDARTTLGVLVDGVSEALSAREDQLEQKPLFGVGIRADFVACMLNLGAGFIPVLELTRVLALSELDGSSAAPAPSA
jgi:purine-binding chemotaxis protein CheW